MKCYIICGTYEKTIFGVRLDTDLQSLEVVFLRSCHAASIKSIASGGKYLASGSADELIQLFNLAKKTDLGTLHSHNGTINSLEFFSNTHLLTGSDDSQVHLFRTSDWELLKTFKAHKGAVLSVSIHPTGRLALSVGKDRRLCIYDLMKASVAKTIKLKINAVQVQWNKQGNLYAIVSSSGSVLIYNDQEKQVQEWSPNSSAFRPNKFVFLDNDWWAMCGQGTEIFFGNVATNTFQSASLTEFNLRIKDIAVIEKYIVVAGSNGRIGVWSFELNDESVVLEKNCQSDFDSRIICMCISTVFGQ